MFERFTDRARRVLVLAQEEARMLHHGFIGTEHLLLGLIHEGDGVAARALESLGITLETVREKVEETIGTVGTSPSGSPPFTTRAKKVLELALREALQFGHSYIGTEHVLLGLVREGEGEAAQILVSLGADLGAVRQQVIQLMSGYQGKEQVSGRPFATGTRSGPAGTLVACSFCGRQPPASGRVVAGSDSFICELCIRDWAQRLPLAVAAEVDQQMTFQGLIAPTGPPPADEAAARQQIELAFSAHGTLSEDGQSLPMVEGGENLGPIHTTAGERHPEIMPIEITVDRVVFVDGERAAVWLSISHEGHPLLANHRGDAVVVDGTWKMARSTFCDLMRMAGVECPPVDFV